MGIAAPDLAIIRTLDQRGLLPRGGRILDLGAQNLYCSGQEDALMAFLAHFGVSAEGLDLTAMSTDFAGRLFEKVGFRYTCLDLYPAPGGVVFDLNNDDLPPSMVEAFDLVMNHGTTEHVMDQRRGFEVIHRCTRPGGIMVHGLPFQGYFDHGLFSYTGKFFYMLARFNVYETCEISFGEGLPVNVPSYVLDGQSEFGGRGPFVSPRLADAGVTAVLRKTQSGPFWLPLDVDTDRLTPAEVAELREKQERSGVHVADRASFLTRAGDAVLAMGHRDAARSCYEQATASDRRCALAWIGLGQLSLVERPDDALAHFARALDVAPRDHEALVGAVQAARRAGKTYEETLLLQVLETFHPQDLEARASR